MNNARTHQSPNPEKHPEAVLQIFSAECSGWRKFIAAHTWIAFKGQDDTQYTVIELCDQEDVELNYADVIHEGTRHNDVMQAVRVSYRWPDRMWWGNMPALRFSEVGDEAETHWKKMQTALSEYPYINAKYRHFGPNCNTLTQYLIDAAGIEVDFPMQTFGKSFYSANERQRVTSYKELVNRILGDDDVYELWNDLAPRKFNIAKRAASVLSNVIPEPAKRDLEYFATLTPESMFELLAEQITFLQKQGELPLHEDLVGAVSPITAPSSELHQVPCDIPSIARRIDVIKQYNPDKLLLIGDDDMTSVGLMVRANLDITVCDIDNIVLDNINTAAKALLRPVRTYLADVFCDSPRTGNYSTVWTDPHYSMPEAKHFVNYAFEAMRDVDDGVLLLNSIPALMGREEWVKLNLHISDSGYGLINKIEGLSYYPISQARSDRYKMLAGLTVKMGSDFIPLSGIPGYYSNLYVYQRNT